MNQKIFPEFEKALKKVMETKASFDCGCYFESAKSVGMVIKQKVLQLK